MKNKEEIKEGILYLLTHENNDYPDEVKDCGYTLLEIWDFLDLNKVDGYESGSTSAFQNLRKLLYEMEDEDLIEERHFGKEVYGRVDYAIENPGFDFLKKLDESKPKNKWILPKFCI
jgi:hypothetical protein